MRQDGNLSANGSTDWMTVRSNQGVHVSGKGNFDSGTITLETRVNGTVYDLYDAAGSALSNTSNFDRLVELRAGDEIRLTLSSAVSSPDIDWSVSGLETIKPMI